jgi:DNA repair protein RecO (recombination protein O)
MLEWTDVGLMLSRKPYGENFFTTAVFTRSRGRFHGMMRGKKSLTFQPLSLLRLTWKSRIEDQLGTFTAETISPISTFFLNNPEKLNAILSATQLLTSLLPEREPFEDFFSKTLVFLDALSSDLWLEEYIRWEALLLQALGFGLDFSSCALGGDVENLSYVSPKTGRAISEKKAAPWKDKLLPLPAFLYKESACGKADTKDLKNGLILTGYFLQNHAMLEKLPLARGRLIV